MKLFEYHYNKSCKEFFLNILPFKNKTLFYIYTSVVDSSLHPAFYFRNVLAVNEGSLLWNEIIIGKFILSINFIHYERNWLKTYEKTN